MKPIILVVSGAVLASALFACEPGEPPPDPALTAIDAFIDGQKIDTSSADWRTKLPRPPELEFDPGRRYFWDIETNKGPIRVEFLPHVAPMHVSSTIYLTRLGYYDGLTFHRVIPGFMAQGGCPLGTGTGSPGYQYAGEFHPDVRHDRPGLLSMANAGLNTDGSQFFITFKDTPHLDGKHTIFGKVVQGQRTLERLEAAGSSGGAPTEPLEIVECRIRVEQLPEGAKTSRG